MDQPGLLKNLAHLTILRLVAQIEDEQGVDYLATVFLLPNGYSSENRNELDALLALIISYGEDLNPEDSDWKQLKGYSHFFQSRFEDAKINFERAENQNNNTAYLSNFYLGLVYEQLNRHDRAVDLWQSIPNIGTYFYVYGYYYYYDRSNYDLADRYFETASALNPRLCESIYHHGLMWNELNLQESAMNTWRKVDAIDCLDTEMLGEILFQKGRLFAEMENYNDAIENLNRAIALDETDLKRSIALGNVYISNENYEEAISLFQEIRVKDPEELWPYIGLCHSERFQKHYDSALGWCAEAMKLFPDSPQPYYYTGLIFFDQRDFTRAIEWFETAVSYQEASSIMHIRLGDSFREIDDDLTALTIYEKALEAFPQDATLQQRIQSLSTKN